MRLRKLASSYPVIVEAYNNGSSLETIAKFHKVSKGTVRNALLANGVVLRTRGRKKKNA